MGSIVSSKIRSDGKVSFEVVVDYDEALQLKGYMDHIYIFSERNSKHKTGISQRGKNEATKYFLIPKQLRQNLKFTSDVSCQRIETKTKTVFIYLVDKHEFKPEKSKNRD